MNLNKIIISLEKQGWKADKNFLEKNEEYLQDFANETEKQALSLFDVSNRLFNEEINRLALEKYPVKMITTGDDPREWDENEQYRDCWIEGYKFFLNG